jgi:DNA-binding protein YbaB
LVQWTDVQSPAGSVGAAAVGVREGAMVAEGAARVVDAAIRKDDLGPGDPETVHDAVMAAIAAVAK